VIGAVVGRCTELQELVALVQRGDVDLESTRQDLGEINGVAALECSDITGRAVVVP
jgi:D-arabinose 1-dehydrogenase-like Zn-dependent alcohol dehydrogenase